MVLFTAAVGAVTHAIGVEVVIGAFLAGIAVRRSTLRAHAALGHLEMLTNAVFAPLFFAVAGLRVDLRTLDRGSVVIASLIVVAVATVGKLGGAFVGGRFGGMSGGDSLVVAAALNARGALEVVVATVGLSVGVLNQESYTAIMLMAIVTTAIAGPLIGVARRSAR